MDEERAVREQLGWMRDEEKCVILLILILIGSFCIILRQIF